MFKVKGLAIVLATTLLVVGAGFAQTLEDNWNDFLHYTIIGQLDLAKGYAQAILNSNPNPEELLALSKENPAGYETLLKIIDSAPDSELVNLTKQIQNLIERGRFVNRADPKIITEEIRKLSSTERGWLIAVKHLQNAGEYAIPFMLNAMADPARRSEFPNIVRALPQVGRDAIRPLAAALQTNNVQIKAEIIKALGEIGYPQSLPYLKYIVEKDASPELRAWAGESIKKIDPKAVQSSASQLFYQLGEQYYYHTESLAPVEDANFANIWFWDSTSQQLVRKEVDRSYFHELMAMRACELALKADAKFGGAIGLWLAAFFKAESAGLDVKNMQDYFAPGHPNALIYATTAGPEYLHQALARAVKDNNAYVALGAIEALATTAGEKSLLYQAVNEQPIVQALSFNNRVVRYSAAIAIAEAGPREPFQASKLVVRNLAEALESSPLQDSTDTVWNQQIANTYALRAAKAMLKIAQTKNPVLDLSAAQSILIKAINDNRQEIRILAGQILAYLNSPDAQRAIAAMALNERNSTEVRISALDSLANSAKLNGNMLVEQMVDQIYALISSADTDPQLRSAAATTYGALNLPSQKVKDLILDQAKS